MFEADSRKFTSKPDPKQEFIHYLRETGASAALQKAMILLYKMPVKPHNLAEYFSEYFENGAHRLTRISLLQAELCYKRNELENHMLKEEAMENQIRDLIDTLGITESDFEEKFMPEDIKMQNRLSVLERYFKGLETGITRNTLELSMHQVSAQPSEMTTATTPVSTEQLDYDEQNNCIRNVKSEQAMLEDIKEIDPWGIVCKASKTSVRKSDEKSNRSLMMHDEYHLHLHPLRQQEQQKYANMPKEPFEPPEDDYEADDDDATLAEVFQQAAHDSMDHDQDDTTAKLHNQLLMVRKAQNVRVADFLGWSPLQSRVDVRVSAETDVTSGEIQEYDKRSDLNLMENEKGINIERLKNRPCQQNMMTASKSPVVGEQPQDTDAFLFDDDEDIEFVYKMLEAEHAQELFDYEFEPHTRTKRSEVKEEVCVPQCNVSDVQIICGNQNQMKDSSKSNKKDCPHCQGNQCRCSHTSDTNSIGFVPGKMINWTHQYNEYPCTPTGEHNEDTNLGEVLSSEEKGHEMCNRSKVEIPLVRIDSSCHCLAGAYTTNEMLGEKEEDEDNKTYFKKLSLEAPSEEEEVKNKDGSASGKMDEAINTEDTALESELQEVFKKKRKSSNRKSTSKGGKEKQDQLMDEVEETQQSNSDIYGILSLDTEVRRTLMGISPSELMQVKNKMKMVESSAPDPPKPKRKTRTSVKDQSTLTNPNPGFVRLPKE